MAAQNVQATDSRRVGGDGAAHRVAIANRFADHLEAGRAVFATGATLAMGLPHTVAAGAPRAIAGFNRWMLLQVMQDLRWRDPRFFTAQQIQAAGWRLQEGAQPVALQIVDAVDRDGLVKAHAQVMRLAVFNAAAISGAPTYQAGAGLSLQAAEDAMMSADFEPGGRVLPALVDWIRTQQQELGGIGVAGDVLARTMSTSLVAAQLLGVHSERALAELQLPLGQEAQQLASALRADPALFFEAVRVSEIVAGQTISLIRVAERAIDSEREMRRGQLAQAQMSVAAPKLSHKDVVPMETNRPVSTDDGRVVNSQRGGGLAAYAAKLEEMFAERAAVLAVPFKERDRAHALGAVFYGPSRVWFVPKGVDVAKFREWNPSEHCLGPVAADAEVIEAFREEMEAMGLDTTKEIIADGKWHNVRALANKGANKSGAYILDLAGRDGTPVGSINNKFSGVSRGWSFDGPLLTPEQKARVRAEATRRAEIADREAQQAQDASAASAAKIIARSAPAGDHPYLRKKGIPSEGTREIAGRVLLEYPEFFGESGKTAIRADQRYLLVPMRTAAGELRAVQAISEDGKVKSFMRGAQKKGTMAVLGAPSLEAICSLAATTSGPVVDVGFVEGFATGASFRRAAGVPVVVCFDAGNLEVVAAEAARKLPANARAVLAADNDQFHVENALGYLAANLGVNPNSRRGSVVEVLSTPTRSRLVSLGDAIADGEWHQAPQGRYRMTLERESDSTEVRAITIEAVGARNDKPLRASYLNRGVEAARVVATAFAQLSAKDSANAPSVVVLVPEFADIAGRPTDWNDMECAYGTRAVSRQVLASLGRAVEAAHDLERQPRVERASAGPER